MKRNALVLLSLASASALFEPAGAQTNGATATPPQKNAVATRLTSAISIDGRLNDAAWVDIPPITDFVQKDPIEGAQPTDRLTPNFLRSQTDRQYVTTLTNGSAATYNNRYVFAFLDRSEFTNTLRLNYVFKPDLTLEMYGEPFAVSGRYRDFGELAAPRATTLRRYGTDNTTATMNSDGSVSVVDSKPGSAASFTLPFRDFNVRSWRSNLVLRWEYRPGSTLYLVWQQNREADAPGGDLVSFGGLVDPFRNRVGRFGYTDPGVSHEMQNFFAVKINYWLAL